MTDWDDRAAGKMYLALKLAAASGDLEPYVSTRVQEAIAAYEDAIDPQPDRCPYDPTGGPGRCPNPGTQALYSRKQRRLFINACEEHALGYLVAGWGYTRNLRKVT